MTKLHRLLDDRALIVLGVVCIGLGAELEIYGLAGLGVVFIMFGMVNRSKARNR
ncbi:hypothetical protein HUU05_28010 [candidate division KSB1 bacterium]|nr:hypothetical protein [candidate division KSB1 bacterium]